MKEVKFAVLFLILLFSMCIGGFVSSDVTSSTELESGGAITVGTCYGGRVYASIYDDIITYLSEKRPDNATYVMYYNISSGALVDTGISWGVLWPAVYEDTIAFFGWGSCTELCLYSISTGEVTSIDFLPDQVINMRDVAAWWVHFPSRYLSIYGDVVAFYDCEEGDPFMIRLWGYNIATGGLVKLAEGECGETLVVGWGVSVYGDIIAFAAEGSIGYYNVTTGAIAYIGVVGCNCPSVYKDVIAFQSGVESGQIGYYNITSGETTWTGRLGSGPSIYGTCIAYSATNIMLYDITTGNVTNTGEVGTAPSVGYNGIAFVVPDTEYGTVKFLPFNRPVARFTYSYKSPFEDHVVTFDASASYDPDGTIVSYEWDFGDGTNGSGMIVTHVYRWSTPPKPPYSVKLTVTDNDELTDDEADTVVVGNLVAINIEPTQVLRPEDHREERIGLVLDKATDFRISYHSTFDIVVYAEISIVAPGFTLPRVTRAIPFLPPIPFYLGPWRFYFGRLKETGYAIFWPDSKDAMYRIFIDPSDEVKESHEDDNETPWNSRTVRNTCPPKILFVPVIAQNAPNDRTSMDQLETYSDAAMDFLINTYPVARSEVQFETSGPLLVPPGIRWWQVLERLTALSGGPPGFFGPPLYSRVVGVVPEGWIDRHLAPLDPELRGAVGFTQDNSIAVLTDTGEVSTVVHEIGHTYGLGDDYYGGSPGGGTQVCERGSGYCVRNREEKRLLPTFMHGVFEPPSDYWISRQDYSILLNEFTVADPEVLLVGGVIYKDNTATFDKTWYRMTEGVEDIRDGSVGNYYIVLLDSTGNTLSRAGFNITFYLLADPPVEVDEEYFSFRIRWVNGTRSVQLQNALGNVLVTRAVSANSPSVTIVYPNGGEILTPGTDYNITWSASDPDNDSLTYSVHISWDSGLTWVPIEAGLEQTSFTYDFANLPGSNRYLVSVVASDGVNVVEGSSDDFFILSSFTLDVPTSPQIISQGGKVNYTLNVTSYGGFSNLITLNAASPDTDNLIFRWVTGSAVTPPPNGSVTSTLEIEATNAIEGGNHTIIISGISDNNTQFAITHIFTLSYDIAITKLTPSKTVVGQGYSASINITIENQGYYLEAFNINAYCNQSIFGNQTVYLHAGVSTTVTFLWNTTGVAKGNYNISAYAEPVQGETDTADNRLDDGVVLVGVPCDVTGPTPGVPDDICNMRDIGYFCDAFINQNPNCDVRGVTWGVPDGTVNMRDIGEACSNFMKSDP